MSQSLLLKFINNILLAKNGMNVLRVVTRQLKLRWGEQRSFVECNALKRKVESDPTVCP